MTDKEMGPNEWEHEQKNPKEIEPLTAVKIVIFLGFLPFLILGFVWLVISIF